jgi:hypothetical protein
MNKQAPIGSYKMELKFPGDGRVFLNYWDAIHGNDVCAEIRDGKLFQYIHTGSEVEESEVAGTDIGDVFEQKEISLADFIGKVVESIKNEK